MQAFGPGWLQESTQRAEQDATVAQAAKSRLQGSQQATFEEGLRISSEGWRPDRCASLSAHALQHCWEPESSSNFTVREAVTAPSEGRCCRAPLTSCSFVCAAVPAG